MISLDELVQSDREARLRASCSSFLGVDDEPAMREFFETEMSADAAHRERWRKGLDEAEQERITELYEATLERLERRGLPLRAGPAPLLRAHARAPTGIEPDPRSPTSNGTGLGHLTRSMAIARRLADGIEPLFLTLSAAAPVVERMGFPVEYVASYATPGSGNDYRWSRRLRGRLRAAIAEADPAVIVFDGTHPYEALLGALPADGDRGLVPAAAVEAGLEPGAARPRRRLRRRARARRAGRVRGRAARRSRCATAPTGSARSCSSTAPSCSPRAEAAAELGLDPARPTVLVSLGQGAEVREATRRGARARSPARGGVQVAALSLGARPRPTRCPEGVVALRATYPMSRYFAAFDAAVAAAGYNAYHELIALGVPSLFVPMPRDTDDQPARARYAERAGIGLGVDGPGRPGARGAARAAARPGERGAIRCAPRRARPEPTGAAEAAALARRPRRGPARRPTRGQSRSRRRSRRGARELPAALGDVRRQPAADGVCGSTRQQLTQPRPRALVARGRRSSRRRRRGRRARRSPRRASRRSARWWSPTRSTRSASCGRSGSGSSTSRRPARARRSSPACPTSAFLRRRPRADPRRAPAAAPRRRGAGWMPVPSVP